MSSEIVLRCQNIAKSYRSGPELLTILKDLELCIQAGELVAIMGASGSGKSTLLNLIGGLDDADEGIVEVAGQQLGGMNEDRRAALRNRYLGFVYQFHHLLPEFSAIENIAMPLILGGMRWRQACDQALPLLRAVGLEGRAEHRPSRLSGGERQRVAIARALVNKPACVLMDEPTGNLDRDTSLKVLDLILDMRQQSGVAVVLVTHDAQVAARTDRRLLLSGGRLVEMP